MKSLTYKAFGEPADVLQLTETPMPELTAGQVLVKMRLAPIHNHDLWTVKGEYGYKPPLPAVGGSEAVGVIEQVSEGVQLNIGQRVLAAGVTGAWSEYFTMPVAAMIPVPDSIPDAIAAQLIAMPLSTLMLLDTITLKTDEWLIQNAANGAVGKTLALIAKSRGLQTINLVRRTDAIAELQALGIEHVISTEQADWQAQVKTITQGQPITHALDSISGQAARDLLDLLSKGGVFVSFGAAEQKAIPVTPSDLIFRQLTLKGFWASAVGQQLESSKHIAMVQELMRLASQGQLPLPVDGIYPLADIQGALTAHSSKQRKGKVLLAGAN